MAESGAFGVVFKIGDDVLSGTPTYVTVAKVEKINGVTIKSVMTEVTAHDSPGGYRKKIPSGLKEVDDIELELAFDIAEATHDNSAGGLLHAKLNDTELAYQIVFPDTAATTWSFDAYCRDLGVLAENIDGHLMMKVVLEVTGQPALS